MSPSWEALTVEAGLLGTMAAYALFAGADFGGGIWDLLAGGTERGARPRHHIDTSVTPVWEGNQTWIVLGLVLLWTAFPTAFAAVTTTLFVPLSLSLLGIVLRGIGFAFRHEAVQVRSQQLNGALFGAASILAPFFLGTAVGAVATGAVHVRGHGNAPGAWLAPTPLVTGALFVASCAYIGAVYLVGDAHRRRERAMVRYFSRRALAGGGVTGLLAAVNMLLLWHSAPYVFHRLLGPALPLVAASVVGGVAALVLVLTGRVFLLRVAAALAVAGVIAAWGVAQYPWLLPTTLTLAQGSAPVASLRSELAVLAMAAVLVVPAFGYLYLLQQRGRLQVTDASEELRDAVRRQNRGPEPIGPHPTGSRFAAAVVAVLVVVSGLRKLVRGSGRRVR
jgi:cytochrome bd ubiquinol oxidase subunit II